MLSSPRVVSSLLGSSQLPVALPCLSSLVATATEPTRLRLHSDGTLSAEDRARLAEALPLDGFVERREADEWVASALARYPHAARFRAGNVLGLKLLDIALLTNEDTVRFSDSDVLFLRPSRGLFELPTGASAVFMSDSQHAYTVRSWHLLRHPRLPLPRRANTGIVVFDRRFFDLDRLEWFLARPELHSPGVWAEQTAWAMLGAATGACRLVDPTQLVIPQATGPLPHGAVALHFVSPVRHRLAEALAAKVNHSGEEPVEVRYVEAGRCGVMRLFLGEVSRRLSAP